MALEIQSQRYSRRDSSSSSSTTTSSSSNIFIMLHLIVTANKYPLTKNNTQTHTPTHSPL